METGTVPRGTVRKKGSRESVIYLWHAAYLSQQRPLGSTKKSAWDLNLQEAVQPGPENSAASNRVPARLKSSLNPSPTRKGAR